jgi:hypothetical protein
MGDNLVPNGLSMVCKVLCSRSMLAVGQARAKQGERQANRRQGLREKIDKRSKSVEALLSCLT